MPDQATQTYATHRRYVPLYHFVVPLILLLNLLGRSSGSITSGASAAASTA
jgi:hypothetical protein